MQIGRGKLKNLNRFSVHYKVYRLPSSSSLVAEVVDPIVIVAQAGDYIPHFLT